MQVPEVRVEGPPSCLHLHQGPPSMPPSFAPAQLTSSRLVLWHTLRLPKLSETCCCAGLEACSRGETSQKAADSVAPPLFTISQTACLSAIFPLSFTPRWQSLTGTRCADCHGSSGRACATRRRQTDTPYGFTVSAHPHAHLPLASLPPWPTTGRPRRTHASLRACPGKLAEDRLRG